MTSQPGSHESSRWLVRGYYPENWPEKGDESAGVVDVIIAASEEDAKEEYRKLHDRGGACSSVVAHGEHEWNDDLKRTAAAVEARSEWPTSYSPSSWLSANAVIAARYWRARAERLARDAGRLRSDADDAVRAWDAFKAANDLRFMETDDLDLYVDMLRDDVDPPGDKNP